jgi:ABC-type lipoprotein export system ATPase subunit
MIVLQNVSRKYPVNPTEDFYALKNVSLTIEDGKLTAIIGPSGSGKTTLLNILSTLDRASEGTLAIDDVPFEKASNSEKTRWRRERVGFVFQSFDLENSLNVLQNVAYPLLLRGVPPWQRKRKAKALLKRFGLLKIKHRHPSHLSGGEKQRVSLARALANDPRYLFADEPTGNLDSANGDLVMKALREVANEGKTVVFVTHNESYAALADVVIRIEDGVIVPAQGAEP